jgi:glycosyltransferase involved in cell wall biosynthesis
MRIAACAPVRNEQDSVGPLIDSLLAQSRPPDEIIIADGGSTDKTVAVVRSRIADGQPVKLVEIGPAFPGRGRNEAVRAASTDWVAFIDAGIRAERRWLERLCDQATADVDVVLGGFEPIAETFFKRCAALAYVSPRVPSEGKAAAGWRGRFIASSLIRRNVWERVGGFPEHLRSAEDHLFLDALEDLPARIVVAPEATVHWEIQPDLASTLRRFALYSRYGILAGRYKGWTQALVRRYSGCAMAAAATGPAAPITLAGLVSTQLGLRALRAMMLKPEFLEPSLPARVSQLVTTTALIGAIDLAAFEGLARYLWLDVARPRFMS